jgi:GNAT superfamily N-acetyltransferase
MTTLPASPVIRSAAPVDQASVEVIVHSAYRHYIARIGQKPGPMLDDYAALIAQGGVHLLERDGTAQAVLVLVPQPDAMLLDNIAVAPAAQGQGLGRTLLAFAETQARAQGHDRIRLYTHVLMTENQAIYARIGYRETHRATEKGLHRVYMEKPLLAQ